MSTIEQVEKLKEKANVSYGEAKAALEVSSGDMLDAIIYLEKQGKIKAPESDGKFTTSPPKSEERQEKKEKYQDDGESFSTLMGKFFKWCGKIIAKGNVHMFEVRRNGENMMAIPLTVLVLLLIFAFWVVIPLIVVGLFFGCRYFFSGPDIVNTGVNKVMDAAANAAEDIKREIKESDN